MANFSGASKTVNFMEKMTFCLKFGIFGFEKPRFTVHLDLTNLTSISLYKKKKCGEF